MKVEDLFSQILSPPTRTPPTWKTKAPKPNAPKTPKTKAPKASKASKASKAPEVKTQSNNRKRKAPEESAPAPTALLEKFAPLQKRLREAFGGGKNMKAEKLFRAVSPALNKQVSTQVCKAHETREARVTTTQPECQERQAPHQRIRPKTFSVRPRKVAWNESISSDVIGFAATSSLRETKVQTWSMCGWRQYGVCVVGGVWSSKSASAYMLGVCVVGVRSSKAASVYVLGV